MDELSFRLLDTVGVWRKGQPLGPATAQQRTVLALLLLEHGRCVPVERMSLALWGGEPPSSARNCVQVQVSRLRRLLGSAPVRLASSASGYSIDLLPDRVDLFRFRSLVHDASTAEPSVARDMLTRALSERRGPVLAGVAGTWLTETVAQNLEDEYLDAVEELARLERETGHPEKAVARLTPLHLVNPLREGLAAALLTSLHASGRRAEALVLFRRTRQALVEELGVEPGDALQRAHEKALRHEGTAPVRREAPAAGRLSPDRAPRQLPPDNAYYSGRQREHGWLDALVRPGHERDRTAAPGIGVITGLAGVGKTALAVHWAHRNRDLFPGGQLYLDLRGFGPHGTPVPAADALRTLIEALGVPQVRIPASEDGRVGMFRSLLADRRILLLLDNARDADQVRPLLPGSPGCVVLVTTRHELTSLVAKDGARPLAVEPLTAQEARQVMAVRLGHRRVTDEEDAVGKLVSLCGGLPLALAMVTAHAVTRPHLTLSELLPEMDEAGRRLDAFSSEDSRADLRSAFSWSYAALSAESAGLFRLLGLHPTPEFTVAAAASLLGVSTAATRKLLAELVQAHLVTAVSADRYTWHDLTWAYARELAHARTPPAERHRASHRMLSHYLHTARAAERQTNLSHQLPLEAASDTPGAVSVDFDDPRAAMDWLHNEHRSLVAAVHEAAHHGFDAPCWQLAQAVRTFLYRCGYFNTQAEVHRVALTAAVRLSDPAARAYCQFGLGQAYARLGRFDDAHAHLGDARDMYHELTDHLGQAIVHTQLSVLEGQRGDPESALDHSLRSLTHSREAGHRPGEAMALNNVGWYSAQLGDYETARRHCTDAVAMLRRVGDCLGEAAALDSLGYLHRSLGRPEQAIVCYEQALTLRRGQERVYDAETLPQLADAQLAAGRPDLARSSLRRALSMLDEFARHEADEVRERLDELENQLGPSGRRSQP
ncbi:AfsR/SARP family transcriptional regulator [Streptomyces sp. MAR4 CNX-425]|uniref:AfsR/SARP family transcriptional regulator n=1 Tax=Streptomyces sp. MAR4 CNX-425 TaxID=3406343 RepID=UPI003B51349F